MPKSGIKPMNSAVSLFDAWGLARGLCPVDQSYWGPQLMVKQGQFQGLEKPESLAFSHPGKTSKAGYHLLSVHLSS